MQNNERFRLGYKIQMDSAAESADVMIYGEICDDWWKWSDSDISAMDFDKMLKEAKAKGVKNLTIRINSPGGDVNQAIAMRTMLMNSGMDEINICIEGMCASAATLIACLPGAHVTMAEGGEYMIHNPKSGAWGEAKDLEAGAKRLRNTESDSASIYARKSGQSEETVRGWMNAETWMTAKEAHERGFVDAVLDAEPIVATVSNRAMAAMRQMYKNIPSCVHEHAETHHDSFAEPAVATGKATEHKEHKEEKANMEIKDITMDQLLTENPELHREIMQAGAQQERERIQEIDDMTPAGEEYAEMAATAKANGTSAMDYYKQIVKHQREKGQAFIENRKKETAPVNQVAGESASESDVTTAKQEMDAYAKEMAALADGMHVGLNAGMY